MQISYMAVPEVQSHMLECTMAGHYKRKRRFAQMLEKYQEGTT